jgi:hypothetical protein
VTQNKEAIKIIWVRFQTEPSQHIKQESFNLGSFNLPERLLVFQYSTAILTDEINSGVKGHVLGQVMSL